MNEEQNTDAYFDEQHIIVDPKQSPIRIDKFLLDRLLRVSRNKIQDAIRHGSITVDNQKVKPNYKIRPGDDIRLMLPRSLEYSDEIVPEAIPLDVVYEDFDLMVVNKPAGMVVHPGVGHWSGTLVNALVHYLKDEDLPIKDGNYKDRAGLVHRIDKNTSGLLVIAKNDFAMAHLAKQFFNHTTHRRYVALVWGQPEEEEGTVVLNVGRHPTKRTRQAVFPEADAGKHAITHWKVLEPMYYVSLMECRLETGRTHQIRVHMEAIGHPLFNDDRYGGDRIRKGTVYSKFKQFVENNFRTLPRHALHARELGFVHPITGEEMRFEAPLPDDFEQAVENWRNYVNDRKSKQAL